MLQSQKSINPNLSIAKKIYNTMTVVLNQCFWLQWVVQTILMNWRDIHWGLKGGCLHWLTPQALPAHSTGCSVSCTSPNKTLCKIRHLASHFFFYKCYTNRSLPSPLKRWNVICIIYQSVWKAKKKCDQTQIKYAIWNWSNLYFLCHSH